MLYVVKHGDNLSQIAHDHGVSVDDILRVNPQITNRDFILANSTIEIPSAATTALKRGWNWYVGQIQKLINQVTSK